jgi:hypothetical protein
VTSKYFVRITASLLILSATALAQYGGGTGTTGTTGSTGTYNPSGKSYGVNGAVIGGIAAGGAGAAALFFAMRHHHNKLVGCVNQDGTLVNEKDKKTYALMSNDTTFQPGERVELKGRKMKGSSFLVRSSKSVGSCSSSAGTATAMK